MPGAIQNRAAFFGPGPEGVRRREAPNNSGSARIALAGGAGLSYVGWGTLDESLDKVRLDCREQSRTGP
ncbi:MAG: hypothetical protein OQL06_04855, partial [Gammaproteobacteria bacterium]|nr:hypothetical protein [Gammaproteobacteria bacterium]